jgi:hypothetical protein
MRVLPNRRADLAAVAHVHDETTDRVGSIIQPDAIPSAHDKFS